MNYGFAQGLHDFSVLPAATHSILQRTHNHNPGK